MVQIQKRVRKMWCAGTIQIPWTSTWLSNNPSDDFLVFLWRRHREAKRLLGILIANETDRDRRWSGVPRGHNPLTTLSRGTALNGSIWPPSDQVFCVRIKYEMSRRNSLEWP